MAFCTKCGAQVADGADVCPACGEKLNQAAPAAKEAGSNLKKAPASKPGNNNQVIGIAVVAVLAVLVIFLCVKIFGKTYKTPIKGAEKVLNKQSTDIEDFIDYTPKFVKSAYKDAMKLYDDLDEDGCEEFKEFMSDGLQDFYDDLEDDFGKNVKISFKIKDKEELSKKDIKELEDGYGQIVKTFKNMGFDLTEKDTYTKLFEGSDLSKKQITSIYEFGKGFAEDLEKVEIKEGYVVSVDITTSGKDDEDTTEDVEFIVIKVDGKWCLEPISFYQMISDSSVSSLISALSSILRGSLPW